MMHPQGLNKSERQKRRGSSKILSLVRSLGVDPINGADIGVAKLSNLAAPNLFLSWPFPAPCVARAVSEWSRQQF